MVVVVVVLGWNQHAELTQFIISSDQALLQLQRKDKIPHSRRGGVLSVIRVSIGSTSNHISVAVSTWTALLQPCLSLQLEP